MPAWTQVRQDHTERSVPLREGIPRCLQAVEPGLGHRVGACADRLDALPQSLLASQHRGRPARHHAVRGKEDRMIPFDQFEEVEYPADLRPGDRVICVSKNELTGEVKERGYTVRAVTFGLRYEF